MYVNWLLLGPLLGIPLRSAGHHVGFRSWACRSWGVIGDGVHGSKPKKLSVLCHREDVNPAFHPGYAEPDSSAGLGDHDGHCEDSASHLIPLGWTWMNIGCSPTVNQSWLVVSPSSRSNEIIQSFVVPWGTFAKVTITRNRSIDLCNCDRSRTLKLCEQNLMVNWSIQIC